MRLRSPAFTERAEIPRKFTCEGENVSPPLEWTDAPPQTKSFVLLCDDPDAPAGTWRHWAVYDLAPETAGLAEGAGRPGPGRGYAQGINDFDRSGYGGPCPPPRHGVHHYHFRLLALSVPKLPVPRADPTCEEVETAAKGSVIAEALLIGTFQR